MKDAKSDKFQSHTRGRLQESANSTKNTKSAVFSLGSLTPTGVTQLQRTIGNRAIANLVTKTSSDVIQRVKKENMTQQELAKFEEMSDWVSKRPALKKLLNMELALSHAPNLDGLRSFINYIEKNIDSATPGFNEAQFYKQAVNEYYTKFPAPNEGQKPSWAKQTTGGVTKKDPVDKEGAKEEIHTPTNPEKPITILYSSGFKHFDQLKKDTKLPKNAKELLKYVNDSAGSFYKEGDHWTIQLGDEPTKKPGGEFEIKPWSILISEDKWQIFHYGPTGIEKD